MCQKVTWQNGKMKTVLQFDVFDLGGFVVRSADSDLFVVVRIIGGFTHMN